MRRAQDNKKKLVKNLFGDQEEEEEIREDGSAEFVI